MCHVYVQINGYIPFLELRQFLKALLFVHVGETKLVSLKSVLCIVTVLSICEIACNSSQTLNTVNRT